MGAADGVLGKNTILGLDEALCEGWRCEYFTVTDIPTVMRDKLNWPKSAELMELWFSLPAREMIDNEKTKIPRDFPIEYINDTLFPWDWLNQFDSVQEALTELNNNLTSPAAQKELKENFQQLLKTIEVPDQYAYTWDQENVIDLHLDWQFQLAEVGYEIGTVDDLYGSLGNFAIYAAVTKATISCTDQENVFHIQVEEVGVYMKDTFDFIGNQYLGHWDFEGLGLNPAAGLSNQVDSFEWNLPAWTPELGLAFAFGNTDFQKYREETGQGGDLYLFSDVKPLPVNFELQIDMGINYDR